MTHPYWREVFARKETTVEPLLVCPFKPMADRFCKTPRACYIQPIASPPAVGRTACRFPPAEVKS